MTSLDAARHSSDPLARALALVEHFASESIRKARECEILAQRATDPHKRDLFLHEAVHRRADAVALRRLGPTLHRLSQLTVEGRSRWWHRPMFHVTRLTARLRNRHR